MPVWHAVILGVVQGLTEFLPISSTAHLYLVPWLSGWPEHDLTFEVALHVGTLVAVLLYFSRTWLDLITAGLSIRKTERLLAPPQPPASSHRLALNHNRALFWLLILGTLPGGFAGLLFEDQIETTLRSPVVMGAAMLLVAFLMAWGEAVSKYQKEMSSIGLWDSVWVGVAQALALIPGVSRSGITMTAALLLDFRRDVAARFSFLLSTPIIAGASLKAAWDLYQQGVPEAMFWPFVVGVITSGLVGYATISFLLRFLQFNTFKIFVYYRVIFGIIILALALLLPPGR